MWLHRTRGLFLALSASSDRTLINQSTCDPRDWDQVPSCPHPLPATAQMYLCHIRQIYGDSREAGKEIQVCKPPDVVTVLRLKKEGKSNLWKKICLLSAPSIKELMKQASHNRAHQSPMSTDSRCHRKSPTRTKSRNSHFAFRGISSQLNTKGRAL